MVAQFFKISFNRVTVNRFEERNNVLLRTGRIDCKYKNKMSKENTVGLLIKITLYLIYEHRQPLLTG